MSAECTRSNGSSHANAGGTGATTRAGTDQPAVGQRSSASPSLLVLGVYADGSAARARRSRSTLRWTGACEELAKQAELPKKIGETLLLYYAAG